MINNGIDFDEYKEVQTVSKEDLGIPKDAFVVGTVGRFAEQKAPDIFLKMAVNIKKVEDNVFFVMVGDGPDRNITEREINNAGLEMSFLLTGWVNNPLDYINSFDVAVLLSRWEGFGLVLPEYMMMKKPIVATKVDAIPYVVGDVGLLVNNEDYQAAAKAVIQIINDNTLKSQLIESGKDRVIQMFNAEREAIEFAALFESLICE